MATESKIKEDSVAVPVAQGDLDAVSNGTFYNPHEVLGGHLGPDEHEDVVTIRVLRPLAKSVTIITENARTQAVHEHNGVFMALIPAIKTDDGFDVPDYRISTEYEDGSTVVSDDPYRYLPTIGDLDMYLFGEGRHERLWEALGARVLRYDDPLGSNDGVKGEQLAGTAFTVWAPNAHAVRVVGDFNGWNGRTHAMRELGSSGVWELFIPGVEAGTIYKYEILNANNEWVMKADPMERSHEIPPRTGSIVVDSVHAWHDENWMDQRAKTDPHNGPVSIYEVHASSWRKDVKNYRELADKLVPYVQKEGFTHVEFMPLAEHPFSGSWGYQVTGYYAIDSRLGGPDDFKYLVEKMHEAGIGVIMDWFRRISRRTRSPLADSMARLCTRIRTRPVASIRIGAPMCSISDAAKCATSWWPTPASGWTSTISTRCAWTRSPRCCTWITAASRASGIRTSTVDERTSRPSTSSRKPRRPRTRTIRAS